MDSEIQFDKLKIPEEGERITIEGDRLGIPDKPIIPYIEGDGIGSDITPIMRKVLDTAVEHAYKGQRKITWFEIFAGGKAQDIYGTVLPPDTYKAIEHFIVAIKGPLTTPVGGGYRSLNVTLRQKLDLYSCIRPVKYYRGVPSPVTSPEKMDVVIFRENTEDVYSGIEWREGSQEALDLIRFLKEKFGVTVAQDSGIGIKPISISCTKRLVRAAIKYALKYNRESVTLVHKGNIMKYTEGSFRDWGYELAKEEFRDQIITEAELWDQYNGKMPEGKVLIKDRIADSMFQQILTRTDEYDIIATPNLNGDYISDAAAAQIGGLGMAPGANIGDFIGLFEATHGSAPKYTGQDKVNPSSLILSGMLMLRYMDWDETADLIEQAIEETIQQQQVTYDLARLMKNVNPIKCSEYGTAICENILKK
ncbi:MAG: isocitrate dehydrogenase (NADP(+)) [Candidatus Helarchaeota archaeon]|nr:isocitrate dehydrogenase (NADP(+)) [Candidatus Helarchaeota archaeon]